MERLEQVFEIIGKPPRAKTCQAIQGIIEEGKEVMSDFAKTDALDARIIAEFAELVRPAIRELPIANRELDEKLQRRRQLVEMRHAEQRAVLGGRDLLVAYVDEPLRRERAVPHAPREGSRFESIDVTRVTGGRGSDSIATGAGNDFVQAKDGRRDVVRCGPGTEDAAEVDSSDIFSGCEIINEGPIPRSRRGPRAPRSAPIP